MDQTTHVTVGPADGLGRPIPVVVPTDRALWIPVAVALAALLAGGAPAKPAQLAPRVRLILGALGLDSGKHFGRTVPSVACPTERLGE
ncbi:MAG TPA: hypothetical protein VN375_06490 [Vicinamibacteria bacterium]|nr:hypothetical protein [Vicinamibacteria bacterium]